MCVVNAAMRMRNIKTDREIRSELPNYLACSTWLFEEVVAKSQKVRAVQKWYTGFNLVA